MTDVVDIRGLSAPTTLNRDRLFGQIAELLGRRIVAGAYPAGALLPNETSLDLDIDVSRTAYREAVKMLTAKGMVEARPKSGTRVAPRASWNLLDPDVLSWQLSMNPSEAFIRELFELRSIIEPKAARLTAFRRTPEQLEALEQAVRRMEIERPYTESGIRADLDFHRALFASAGNMQIACLSHVVVATIQWSMILQSSRSIDEFSGPMRDHRRIMDAIASRDGDVAAAMMEVLITESLNDTLAQLRQRARNSAL